MSEEIELGDVVRLISGGPKMTVERIVGKSVIHCVWFQEDIVLHREEFRKDALEVVFD